MVRNTSGAERLVVLVVKSERGANQGRFARAAVDVHGDERIKIAQPEQHQRTGTQRDRDIDAAVQRALQGFAATHATEASECGSRGAPMRQITGGAEHHRRHGAILPHNRSMQQIGFV